MQRLTNLCSVLNDMEPICVLNHVFVLREVCKKYASSSCLKDNDTGDIYCILLGFSLAPSC